MKYETSELTALTVRDQCIQGVLPCASCNFRKSRQRTYCSALAVWYLRSPGAKAKPVHRPTLRSEPNRWIGQDVSSVFSMMRSTALEEAKSRIRPPHEEQADGTFTNHH